MQVFKHSPDFKDQSLVLSTTANRLALTRKTHRSVITVFSCIFLALASVILASGLFLAHRGEASTPGVVTMAVAFLGFPLLAALSILKMERRSERFLAADGVTLLRADDRGITVADAFIPYERITCLYASAELELYSSGGISGEMMAHRLGLSEGRPPLGRAAGALIGTGQRKRLYRDGAKSAITLLVGVDRMSSLNAPEGMLVKVPLTPQDGDDPGRLVMPFGAYLDFSDLELLLGTVHQRTGGQLFPLGVVDGTLNWASAHVGPSDTREKIWADSASILGQ